MQKESSTVASSIVSLMNETKHALSRYGYTRELPKSVLSKRKSMKMGKMILSTAKNKLEMHQGTN